jgi:hypothetical protein
VSHFARKNEEPPVRHTTSISSPDIFAADQPIFSSLLKTPLQPTLNPTVMQGNTNTHAMINISRNNIFKPKANSDAFVRYPLPKTLLTSLHSSDVEATC